MSNNIDHLIILKEYLEGAQIPELAAKYQFSNQRVIQLMVNACRCLNSMFSDQGLEKVAAGTYYPYRNILINREIWLKGVALYQGIEQTPDQPQLPTPPVHTVTHNFPDGITVAELKRIVAAWPDVDDEGKPNGVWAYDDEGRTGRVRMITAEPMYPKDGKFNLMLD